TALALLATIYVLLFSTYFADPRGIVDGLYQGIYYWLGSQHDYARGDQPWYYYLILMPVYEPLALFTAIGAASYLFTRRPGVRSQESGVRSQEPEVERQGADDAIVAPTIEAEAIDAETKTNHQELASPSPNALPLTPLFPLFLAFWFIGALVAFSWAGEKMPWLVTHIALPGNLLAAWAIGKLLDRSALAVRGDGPFAVDNLKSRVILIPLAVIFLLIFLGVALWRLFGAGEGQEGQAALLQGLIPLLMSGVLIYTLLTIAQTTGTRLTLALAALTVIGALAIYEIHSTWMVVYDHPDTPREMLVFVQSSPDVPLISQEIHELAISQTRNRRTDADPIGGYSMPVIMDIGDDAGEYSLAWPYYWYFRDMQRIENRKADFFQNASADSFQVPIDAKQPDGEKEFAPVVMVSVPHMTESTRAALEA
ncbi:MAG TPA: TIGR03663 family protein, partial [Roseiflexaceae bacterium]|nr:TIGR03663 family protein [Roseiflexaceae bacterium]